MCNIRRAIGGLVLLNRRYGCVFRRHKRVYLRGALIDYTDRLCPSSPNLIASVIGLQCNKRQLVSLFNNHRCPAGNTHAAAALDDNDRLSINRKECGKSRGGLNFQCGATLILFSETPAWDVIFISPARNCVSTWLASPSDAKSLSSLSPRNLFFPPPQLFHTFVKELLFSSQTHSHS